MLQVTQDHLEQVAISIETLQYVNDKAHVAQSEEEESAFFMVSVSILSDVPNSNSKCMEVIDDGVTAQVSVEPKEERVRGTVAPLSRDRRVRHHPIHRQRRRALQA